MIGRYAVCAAIGVVQAALLIGVIAWLGIAPTNWLGLFGVLLISSWASIAIVSTLVNLLGRLGQLCAMIILVLQLTCSGGTFPTPLTQGMFFTDAHPYVSFTYSIDALREVISAQSVNAGRVWSSLGWLAVYLVGALTVACLLQPVVNRVVRKLSARHHQAEAGIVAATADAG